ncbi:hypothetical protein ACP2W0_08370 [Pseudobacillus badius]|uniref:hypothetical protein n=1 Tax=Bacillus badius TaxID=1455 RepID=UPI003CFABA1E
MSYKDRFIEMSKEVFKENLEEKRSKEKARNIIADYFNDICNSLKNEEQVAGRNLKINIGENQWSIELRELSKLSVHFSENKITVLVKPGYRGYEDTLQYEEGKFFSSQKGYELSEHLLDVYLEEVFDSILTQLVK